MSAYKAFDCVLTDDDGKVSANNRQTEKKALQSPLQIHLLDMRCSQPAVVHSESRVQAQENAGIVAVASAGNGDDFYTAFENGVLSNFDLRRREFNDVLMLDDCFTSVCTAQK